MKNQVSGMLFLLGFLAFLFSLVFLFISYANSNLQAVANALFSLLFSLIVIGISEIIAVLDKMQRKMGEKNE